MAERDKPLNRSIKHELCGSSADLSKASILCLFFGFVEI